jgi:hypothetical protein
MFALFLIAIIEKPSYEFVDYNNDITIGERLNLFNVCQR